MTSTPAGRGPVASADPPLDERHHVRVAEGVAQCRDVELGEVRDVPG
ncbi:hypothetical protein [Streptomyces sp. MMG1121]|nr:hypothetical protein [Streptomyces sp. MMG1121]